MPRKKKHLAEPRGRLTRPQQELAERYLPLARTLARPMKRAWPTAWEDFESAACLALVEAAQVFDPARNVKFTTFARLRITGALRDVHRRMAIRHAREERGLRPHFGPLGPDSELQGQLLDTTPDPPIGQRIEATEEVERWLAQVPTRHAAACRLIYLEGMSQLEAAAALGCSQSRLSCMHREALAMLNGSWYRHAVAGGAAESESESEFECD